jgi:hypothetical protein
VTSLIAAKETLAAKFGCQVVIISFGLQEGALRWKNDVSCPFQIYLDPERKLYNFMGMQRSLAKVKTYN